MLCKYSYFPVIESRDQVEDIDPLPNEDKHEGELVPPVHLLDVDLETAPHVEEPDEGGAGVVDDARYLRDEVHGGHKETFLKSGMSEVGEGDGYHL